MILASLKPYYYYLIGERKKTIEVRKSALKNLPQYIVFYMSKDEKSFAKIPKEFQEKYRKHFGKVGLAIVCDKITKFTYDGYGSYSLPLFLQKAICLDGMELYDYLRGKDGYGWHISDLKVYDKPKKLSEFYRPCSYSGICYSCNRFRPNGTPNDEPNDFCDGEIIRPPQSYMYVEEVEEQNNNDN